MNQNRVIEEIGEVLQAMGKLNRFGVDNPLPKIPGHNHETELLHELDDCIYEMRIYREYIFKNCIVTRSGK